jgi:ribosome-binding protein aMBF1 (putative translation factor)
MYTYRMPRRAMTSAELEFGRRVSSAFQNGRLRAGLSGGELAEASLISLDAIRSIESGRVTSPGLWTAAHLARTLSLSLDELARDALRAAGEGGAK